VRILPRAGHEEEGMEILGGLYTIAVLFVIVLAICWIILPFALIGTKPLLRQLLAEMKRNNDLLDQRLPALRPVTTGQPHESAVDRLKGCVTKPLE
jgi:hypothetical protein